MLKCAILKVHLTAFQKKKENPKSKLGLSRVTMKGQTIPQPESLRWLNKRKATRVVMGHQGIVIKYETNT